MNVQAVYSYHRMQSARGSQYAIYHIACRAVGRFGWMTWCGVPIKRANFEDVPLESVCKYCSARAQRVGESVAKGMGARS